MRHEIQKSVSVAIIMLNNALSKYIFWRRDGIISFGLTSATKLGWWKFIMPSGVNLASSLKNSGGHKIRQRSLKNFVLPGYYC